MNLLAALEISLLVVCIWGLIAILLTGQFNTLVILACILVLIAGYRLRRKGWQPSALAANVAAVLVFAASGVIFFTSLNLLIATVYLFLFLQVTKYVTRQNLAEIRWCYLISLFHVIGASVITTAITFGVMLAVYIFLVLISLRLYVMAREWEASATSAIPDEPVTVRRRWLTFSSEATKSVPAIVPRTPQALFRSSLFLTVIISLMAGVLFSAIPRLATQNLFQAYGPAPEEPAVSAFSENVEFGSFTEIQQDDAVALFVQPTGKNKPSHVRMRGVALDSFDGKSWRRTNSYVQNGSRYYEFHPLFTTRLYPQEYVYRVIQPPGVTNFLFGDSFPTAIHVPAPFQFSIDRQAQAVYLDDMPPKEFQYEVHSMHEELSERKDPALHKLDDRPTETLLLRSGQEWGFQSEINDVVNRWEERWVQEADPNSTETAVLFVDDPSSTAPRTIFDPNQRSPEELENIASERRIRWERYREWRQRRFNETVDQATTQTSSTVAAAEPMDVFGGSPRMWGRSDFMPRSPQERQHRYLAKCLDVPEMLATGRVPELAVEWTEDEETTFAKAIAIESRLRNEFGYSLTPTAKGNFIEDFLFEVQEGHCEYFATSMAILLRNVGIPARIVNGFYSNEWNPISGNFTVRQRDAHSWVEAWMGDDYGWMTFDPTPPSGVSRRSGQPLLENFFRVIDAVRVRWYRYVVDYSITDQVTMVQEILNWRRRLMRKLEQMEIMGISADDRTTIELGEFTGEIDWRPVAVSGVIIVLLITWQTARWIRRRRGNRYSDVRFYDELLRLLSRRGMTIKPGQTPMEFAQDVAAENAQWHSFLRATAIYYARRYNGNELEPGERQMIAELKRLFRQKKK